ncbi:nitroreductase [Cytobacillus sp. FJAT-54145]|uniref:Putative NAD(P)H nitroreductase n=1 Tax=Cytobacillus spartinae TaxID=3299023 RepID=A0ABW6K922_9BACI
MSNNNIATVIKERRSIKRFKSDAISKEVLFELLNIAAWAPNHGLREPWRFVLFMEEGREKLADAIIHNPVKGGKKQTPEMIHGNIMKVPVHLLVVMPEDPRQKEWEEDYAAVCTFIQNLQLAAWEKEIGTIWKTSPFIHSPYFREKMGVKPGEKIVGMIQIGYPDAIPEARPRTAIEDKTVIIDRVEVFEGAEA